MEVMNNQFLNTGEVTVKIEDSQRYGDFLSVNSHQQNLDFMQTASCAMNYGNVSPGSEYGVYNSSNGNDSCMSPPYIFSTVQDTLNNYGVSAYSTDYDRSFNSTLDTSLNTTLGDSPPYPSHITPSSTPAPSDLELPAEEPSLQLMENLSLQNLSPMHSNSYTGLQDNLQNSNSYFMNSSMSSSPAPSLQSSVSPFPSYNYDTNLQLPSTSQYNPQFQSYGNNTEVFDPITVLDSINENDLLNIQGEYNIDQIISSEGLGNDKNGPSSLGNSPSLPNDPYLWKKADVRSWINWAKIQFSLSDRITPDMLPGTGKELCKLSRQQMQQRVGDDAGKQLAEYLEYLLNKFGKSLPEMKANIDPYELYREACSRLCLPGSSQIQLWQFLLELLITREHVNIITWENTNSEFKILDPDGVATLWGIRKSKPNMNYDKLSRALRYYYDRNLMYKVAGKRYAYKVSFPNLEILHAAQHGSEPRPQPDLALFSAINNSRSPKSASSSPKMC